MKIISSKTSFLHKLIQKYNHAWVFLYTVPYILWFTYLQKNITSDYTLVHIRLDDFIPFNEIFVIPYLLWFVYVGLAMFYFFFHSKEDFYRYTAFLFIGMTICLMLYTIWPNGQALRPSVYPRDNIFTKLVMIIQSLDPAVNVCPSIHVFNSIGTHIAITQSELFKKNSLVRNVSFVLMLSICLSTVFLKQHSCFDAVCAMILSLVMYLIVYLPAYTRLTDRLEKDTLPSHHQI